MFCTWEMAKSQTEKLGFHQRALWCNEFKIDTKDRELNPTMTGVDQTTRHLSYKQVIVCKKSLVLH